jgi:hypothetical protein
MTNNTETTETTKKKGAKPTHEIFPVGADGKPNYSGRIAAWSHKTGGGMNFSIGDARYVAFPVRQKQAAAPQPGEGA